jgi:hypothetical protein
MTLERDSSGLEAFLSGFPDIDIRIDGMLIYLCQFLGTECEILQGPQALCNL